MGNNFAVIRSLLNSAEVGIELNENSSEFEKLNSLLSILNGFEEYTLNKDGIIIGSNLEAVTITGYEEWEVLGKHISMFYSLEDQFSGRPLEDLAKAEKRLSLTITGLRIKKRSTSFWAKIKFRALTDSHTVVGFKMTIFDATHKAVSNHRVKRIRDEYLNLFNNSFVGIFKVSMSDYSILMMNDKARQLMFQSAETLSDTRPSFEQIFESNADFAYLIAHLTNNKKLEEWEVKLKNERWVKLSCRYFVSRNFAEGIIVDNSSLRKASEELHRLQSEFDQFIYHASHELRGPLVSLLGLINIMDHEKSSNEELCHHLRDKITQLDELLKNVTSIAYNNMQPLTIKDIEWEVLLTSIFKEIKASVKLDVEVHLDIKQYAPFKNDALRIRTILRHIISNSFKYLNPMVESSWVHVSVVSNQQDARIIISDNGIGIALEYIKDIFKMFYKATEYPKGAGLGLYLAKALTEKIGGSIEVSSNIGQGTTFTITIPNG